MSCSNLPSEYGNRSATTAGMLGFANGVAGMVGASSFWTPYDDSGLDKLTADFTALQNQMTEKQSDEQQQLTELSQQFLQEQLETIQLMQQFNDEMMDESLNQNWLYTTVTFILCLIIIIYLLLI